MREDYQRPAPKASSFPPAPREEECMTDVEIRLLPTAQALHLFCLYSEILQDSDHILTYFPNSI